MNRTCLVVLSLMISSCVFAQSHTATVDYQKVSREALVNEIGYAEKTVTNAIEESMSKMGAKGKSNKGYVMYRGVSLPDLGGGSYDLYFSVERKSKKEKESSVITMMVSTGDDKFITTSTDAALMDKAKGYLDNLWNMVAAYDLEQQIGDQEDLVKKNEKKMNSLMNDANDLEKKRRKVEEEITDNKKNQGSQQQELENQRKILETMKGKRKQ